MDLEATIYLKDILHLAAQALLVPVMVALAALIIYAVFSLGSLLVELLTERRRFKVAIPEFINAINDAAPHEVEAVIGRSGLLKDQKLVLLTVARSMSLPKEDLFALAKAELSAESGIYDKVTSRNDLVVKAGPIVGLLGTLIPLGPGIVAMGQGDVDALATSLLIAFDTTAAGLSAAVVFMFISRVRKRWYARYMLALETGMRCLLQKAELEVAPGELSTPRVVSPRVKRAETRAAGLPYQPQAPAQASSAPAQVSPAPVQASPALAQAGSAPAGGKASGAGQEEGHHGL
ncbi:MAG: MotA/TolQ/ExbB proton channel family protein [Coriobacteriales bacterium]|jgi:biopolymer transport protein ExbB/TolQ|nr:MotA/TolQ/ExbB proton channel family protein [Coriobacteriales bacterium]